MKCDYCGATMPDPPNMPNYAETYKELREKIGQLEYDNGIVTSDKRKFEDWLIECRNNLSRHQSLEKKNQKEKRVWKRLATVLLLVNILTLAAWFSA